MTSSAPLAQRAQAPARLDLPSADLGLTWRALTSADVGELHHLIDQIERHDNPPYRTTLQEAAERYEADWHGISANVIGGFRADGHLGAYGAVTMHAGQTLRVYLEGGVLPAQRHQGIGSAVLAWEIARARQLLAASAKDLPARLVVEVEDDMQDSVEMLRLAGFTPERYYTELRRDLATELPEGALERPLVIEPWNAELDEQVRSAHNVAFAEHWASEPQSQQEWVQGRNSFAPELSFIALDKTSDRTQLVGYLLSARYEQDWPSLGWSEGYVDLFGVLPKWRGRGVGKALLARAMRSYAQAGLAYAALGVDTSEPGKVFGLYSTLEFRPTRGSTIYTIHI